ncbi:MAG: PAS domain-containing sensor histidine kinase [Flavobacteriaceae bacterium]|nr:PAS domain-containing sensor histidine kinase [Flavobacteriaceae bacterium]
MKSKTNTVMFEKDNDLINKSLKVESVGIILLDAQQQIIEANQSAERMFGYKIKELNQLHFQVLFSDANTIQLENQLKVFLNQGVKEKKEKNLSIYGMHKSKSMFPVEVSLNIFKLCNKEYIMALVTDISKRKEQEIRISKLNAEFEQKIILRTKELNETISQLEHENMLRVDAEKDINIAFRRERELNKLKTNFLSLVSHEFKTPLSGILTSIILLGKYNLSEQQEKRDKHIKIITDKVQYLNNILNDFLSLEKLETGNINYNLSTFKLGKVIKEVVSNANILLKKGQKIDYPNHIDEISLFQDEKIIELTLSNLINNAIKYSSENSVIAIKVRQDIEITTLEIIDDGIGIPKIDQKNIFNRYFRAENALLTEGTGIGLNISKTHIENLGGSINFESAENKGTTFTISIPNTAQL